MSYLHLAGYCYECLEAVRLAHLYVHQQGILRMMIGYRARIHRYMTAHVIRCIRNDELYQMDMETYRQQIFTTQYCYDSNIHTE